MRNLIDDHRGMTLVEVIVGMVITVLVIVAAGNFYLFTNHMYRRNADQSISRQEIGYISRLFRKQISYATSLEISRNPDSDGSYDHVIRCSADGTISIDGVDLYGRTEVGCRFFCRVERNTEEGSDPILEFYIIQTNETLVTIYSSRNVVKLVNLDLDNIGNTMVYPQDDLTEGSYDSLQEDLYIHYSKDWESETE